MTDKAKSVLYFFSYLEILWGIWVIAGFYNNLPFAQSLNKAIYPISTFGFMLVVLGIISLFLGRKDIWYFVILVSTPITFLGLLFIQRMLDNPSIWGNFATITSTGIFSAMYAGRLFGSIPKIPLTKS